MAKSNYRPEQLIAKQPEGDVPTSRPMEVNETSQALGTNVLGAPVLSLSRSRKPHVSQEEGIKMTSRVTPLIALLVGLTILLAACESRPAPTPSAGPQNIVVVTTMTVLGDLIQQVGGDKVEVKSLVPPGGEVHTYQPTPEDIKSVAQARIVFYNGVHLEDWLDGTIRGASKPDLPIVLLAEGLRIIQEAGEEPNPHLWMDVANAKTYVERIRDGLSKVDSGNAGYYGERARSYLGQLDELDKWIQTEVESIPKVHRKLVTFHDAFPYFAKRYGFALVGVVVSSPGKEPSAREGAVLVRRIKRERVPAIFAEAQFSPSSWTSWPRTPGSG